MKRGEEVEQFLRCTEIDGKRILSWLTLRKQGDEYVLIHHKQYDEGAKKNLVIYEFKYLHLPKNRDEPVHLAFPSLDAALEYGSKNLGASNVKWVAQGVVQEEYRDFKLVESC